MTLIDKSLFVCLFVCLFLLLHVLFFENSSKLLIVLVKKKKIKIAIILSIFVRTKVEKLQICFQGHLQYTKCKCVHCTIKNMI